MASYRHLASLLEDAFPSREIAEAVPPAERLRLCVSRRSAAERVLILRDVRELVGKGLCDMQMSELIAFELGAHLRPEEMEMSPSEWVEWVGRQVRST